MGEVIQQHQPVGDPQRVVVRERDDPGTEPDPLGPFRGRGDEDLWRADDFAARRVMLPDPRFVETQRIKVLDELEITLEVERLGNTSMVSAIAIVRDGDTLVEGRIVHIFVRADRLGEKAAIPDHVRRILQPYTVEPPDY